MIRRHATAGRRVVFPTRRADKIRALLALGAVLGPGAVGTLAAWSDTSTATSGLFSTGSLDIKVNSEDVHSFVALSMKDMVPGSTKTANLVVRNSGSLPFGYTMRAVAAGDDVYGQHLRVSVFPAVCSGTPVADAVQMRSTESPIALVTGPRPLAAGGAQETLCFSVSLDSSLWNQANWPTALQVEGKSVTVSFEFTATVL